MKGVGATSSSSTSHFTLRSGLSLSERLLSEAVYAGYFTLAPALRDRMCIVKRGSLGSGGRRFYCSVTDSNGDCVDYASVDESWALVRLSDVVGAVREANGASVDVQVRTYPTDK